MNDHGIDPAELRERFHELFGDYDDDELRERVLPHLIEERFEAGAVICRERAPGDRCFFLVEGTVSVEKSVASGRSEQIGELEQGTVFGQLVLLDGGSRSATCLAQTDCRVLELTRADFDAMRARGTRLALDLQLEIARALARQIRQATENLSAMSETRVEDPMALSQRLERFLRGPRRPEPADDNLPREALTDATDEDDGGDEPRLKLRDVEL